MALNKKQTSIVVKVIVVIVALAFISLPIMSLVGSIGSGGGSTPTGQGGSESQIAQQFQARIDANNQSLAKKPKDYATLVDQGNAYSDWATQLLGQNKTSGADKPVFFTAIDYYKKALAVKPGDPAVTTDLAIAQFYYGDSASAIKNVEGVMAKDPTFAPAFFNAGIFYGSSGQNAKAIAALQTALKLDPKGQNAGAAQQMIGQLQQAGPGASAPATSGK
jgi:tetratricopeptide (TPR) repeat protein